MKQRFFIKIQVSIGKNASQCFMEHCRREVLPYRTIARWVEAFHQRERVNVNHRVCAGRPVAATDYLHVQAVRVLLEEDRHWTYVEISKGTWY